MNNIESEYQARMLALAEEQSVDALRCRLFVIHYIKTLDPVAAATFASYDMPKLRGPELLEDPYVQSAIAEMLNCMEGDAIMTRNEIMFRLKTEAFNERARNQGARVAALDKMAKISGMMENKDSEVLRDIHVMVVPPVASVEDWDQQAKVLQSSLKDTVKD